ncbi:MAG: hypothetical protein ACTHLE_04150 [Agriterribacter sp.]
MIYETLKLPIPIYNRIEKQYRYTKADVPGKVIATRDRILPFQWVVDGVMAAEDITEWTIRQADINRTIAYTLTSKVDQLELVETAAGSTYILYKATDIALLMTNGVYHMEWVVNGLRYYSEQFEIRCDSPYWNDIESPYTRFEWGNSCDVGPILYQTGYKNRIYLDTKIHNETPTIEEEGDENGEGVFIPSAQRYIDNLNIEDILPYHIADALLVMAMHKDVTLTTPFSTYTSTIKELKPTVAQEENTWLYRFTMTFQQESIYKNGNCCENIALPPPPAPSCGATVSNLVTVESAGGVVTATWNLIGDADRVSVGWVSNNALCPQFGQQFLPGDATSFQLPDAIYKNSVVNIVVIPQCANGDDWVNGTGDGELKQYLLGPECNPGEEPEPEEPASRVIVQNDTTNLPIFDVLGISGYNPPPIAPQSQDEGTHDTAISGGYIAITFDEAYGSFKHWEVFVNGASRGCQNLSSSPAYYIVTTAQPISSTADIKIVVSNGVC